MTEDKRHAPECESECTEGADCNCGADVDTPLTAATLTPTEGEDEHPREDSELDASDVAVKLCELREVPDNELQLHPWERRAIDRRNAWQKRLQLMCKAGVDAGEDEGYDREEIELRPDLMSGAVGAAHRLIERLLYEADPDDEDALDVALVACLALHYANADEKSTPKGRAARRARARERRDILDQIGSALEGE